MAQDGELPLNEGELIKQVDKIQKAMQDHRHTLVSTANTNVTGNYYPPPTYHHTVAPNYHWHTANPPPSYVQATPHISLGSEEECEHVLAMLETLGVEPTDYLSGKPMLFQIGDKFYSFLDVLTAQFQFMHRINLLLVHRGLSDEN